MTHPAHSRQPSMDEIEGRGRSVALLHAAVFIKDGREFIIPGVLYSDADPDRDAIGMTKRAWAWMTGLGARCEWRAYPIVPGTKYEVDLPTVLCEAGHPAFMHGGGSVWMIAGPEFDAARDALPPAASRPCPRCGEMRDAVVPEGCRDPKRERLGE